MTNQPTWSLVWATDDSALYVDTTGVYAPELALLEEINDASKTKRFQVYRFPCDGLQAYRDESGRVTLCFRCYKADWSKPACAYREWYQKSLPEIARSCGRSTLSLVRDLISEDASALASAYRDIGGYHGYDNFDSEPDTWSEYEAQDWPERKDPETDPDDYADWLAEDTGGREEFLAGYITCAMWCGVYAYKCDDHDDTSDCDPDACSPEMVSYSELGGPDPDEGDLTDEAATQLKADADAFFTSHVADLIASGLSMEQCGHDFWLTRNRHGAGFWDRKSRGKKADAALDRLTEASHAYGEMSFVADSDGKVSVM